MEAPAPLADTRLAQLQEIPLPEPVPYVPRTIGWAVIAALLLLALVFVCWRTVRHRRLNAYRREALAELDRIDASARHDASSISTVPALLKRTAIAATSREAVASLSGDEWLRFLDRTMKGEAFQKGAGRWLPLLAYADSSPPELSADEQRALIELARRWIRTHRASEHPPQVVRHAHL